MEVIYKYPLQIMSGIQTVELPDKSKLLSAQMQGSSLCLWARVNPKFAKINRHFRVIGTGQEFNSVGLEYVATIQDAPFVWHLFEVL